MHKILENKFGSWMYPKESIVILIYMLYKRIYRLWRPFAVAFIGESSSKYEDRKLATERQAQRYNINTSHLSGVVRDSRRIFPALEYLKRRRAV